MNTGCPDCDRTSLSGTHFCPKHLLEYLKWIAESAQINYLEELKKQSRKEQNEDSAD